MYISFDNGVHWQPFQLNLPQVPVTDIKLHNKDLIVSTQGRAMWIVDNVSSLHEIGQQITTTAAHLYKPRDGYRTRVSPLLLGPQIDYYLPAEPAGPVTLEILDASGNVVNSYSSDTPAGGGGRGRGGRGGRGAGAAAAEPPPQTAVGAAAPPAGGGGGDEPQFDPEAGGGGGGRGRGSAPPPRVTKNAGMNRVVWDVRYASGLSAPPGAYQVRLKAGDATQTQPLNVLIDPRIAAEGITAADLKEQYEHNVRVRELGNDAQQLLARVRTAMNGASGETAAKLRAIYDQLVDTPEGVRYNKPGLTTHIRYLGSMTANTDQKIGRDAIDRYQELKKELAALEAQMGK